MRKSLLGKVEERILDKEKGMEKNQGDIQEQRIFRETSGSVALYSVVVFFLSKTKNFLSIYFFFS